jgi:hypothetical protein
MMKLYYLMIWPLAILSYLLEILMITWTERFGLDDHRMAKETMATMINVAMYLRDDMSIVVEIL